MRIPSLCIISMMSVLLAGCQTGEPVKTASLHPTQQQMSLTSPEQSMLSLGRGMSDNSVDIYEPGVDRLDVPTIESFTPRSATVPENNNVVVRHRVFPRSRSTRH